MGKNPVMGFARALYRALHRGALCQFSFRWIHYYSSNKSTGLETGKSHLCALGDKTWKKTKCQHSTTSRYFIPCCFVFCTVGKFRMSFDFPYAIDSFKQDLCNYPKKLQNQSKDSSAFHNYVRAHLFLVLSFSKTENSKFVLK